MAVRHRRPLIPPPYPRRNRYTPSSSKETALHSPRPLGRARTASFLSPLPIANTSLVCDGNPEMQSPLCSVSALRRKLCPLPCSSSPHETRSAGLSRSPFQGRGDWKAPLCFAAPPLFSGGSRLPRRPPPLRRTEDERRETNGKVKLTLWVVWYLGKSPSGIVTHFPVEMCYDSVTFSFFQVFANFTISFTGVTLASRR